MTARALTTMQVVTRPFVWFVSVFLAVVATQSALLSVVLLGYVYASMHRYLVGSELGDRLRDRVWQRVKLGVSGALTISSLALLPAVLWAGTWYAGWDNSFNKGYEQAVIGPLTGVAGVLLFLLLMPYLQIAQARHAETLDWRCVYRVRENLRIWAGAPVCAALLPLAYAGVGFGLFLLFSLPAFLPQMTQYADMTEADVLSRLQGWYFIGGGAFVAGLFAVKRLTAWVYRRAAGNAESAGRIRFVLYPIVALLWLAVVAEIFVGQFLNYHGNVGWLNQPLMQLPFVNRIPG